ncbi:methyltransferase domain-containing protein [Streptomyces sp. HU2014]|uniref:methyltransferase domain-containing protein n=1 Tax=Streptomyces sp. HU2014 TaxID=2939414 RepID=UPI0024B3A9B8|nr:methyltransferase domain-containing protein [Streptomyces sp. HU2014]
MSSSKPSLVLSMLTDLDPRPGDRVLEVGAGTGWNAGLLAHRLGARNVTTIDIDPSVVRAARAALHSLSLPVEVLCGDGYAGVPARASYDRIVATCGLRQVPFAWVEQTRPGGIILLPWGTDFSSTEGTARLAVSDDGASASGPFTGLVEFMRMRAQRLEPDTHDAYVTEDSKQDAVASTTSLPPEVFADYSPAAFAIGLRVHAMTYRRGPNWL